MKKKISWGIGTKLSIIIAVIIVSGALAFQYKSFFIAASVDGSCISRFEVVEELEKMSGKAALDSIISYRLIDNKADSMSIVVGSSEIDAEIKIMQDELAEQGGDLETVLLSQGVTLESFREQIAIQMKLEKILADKIAVSGEDVDQYIEENQIDISAENTEEYREFIKAQLEQQKLSSEAMMLVDSLHAEAEITYYREY